MHATHVLVTYVSRSQTFALAHWKKDNTVKHHVSVYKPAKKELSQYPAIMTSHLVNNPYHGMAHSLPA